MYKWKNSNTTSKNMKKGPKLQLQSLCSTNTEKKKELYDYQNQVLNVTNKNGCKTLNKNFRRKDRQRSKGGRAGRSPLNYVHARAHALTHARTHTHTHTHTQTLEYLDTQETIYPTT
jgi:hypothetical protein